jgi:hypothetical protein
MIGTKDVERFEWIKQINNSITIRIHKPTHFVLAVLVFALGAVAEELN